MRHWKKTAAISALLVTVSAMPAAANELVRPISAPVDAVPISMPVEIIPISAPVDGVEAPERIGTQMRIAGPVEWIDLEGGFYAVDGWRLIGDNESFAKLVGQEVVVVGTEFTGISFQMVPAINVESITLTSETALQTEVSAKAPLPTKILVNGEAIDFALGAPTVEDGLLLVPLRSIAEALDGVVTWDDAIKLIHIDLPDRTAMFHIGQMEAEMHEDGVYYIQRNMLKMAAAPVIIGDRTLISADALTSIFGLTQVKDEEGVLSLVSGEVIDLSGPAAQADVITGTIEEIDENGRILVVGPAMSNGDPIKVWFALSEESTITVGDAAGTKDALKVGTQVEVVASGPMLMSYPAQGGAASVKVVEAAKKPGAGSITGQIEELEEGRILVKGEAAIESESILYLFIREETEIVKVVDGVEQPATAADLALGLQVEADYSGPMLKSYPGQVGADKVRILEQAAEPEFPSETITGKISKVEEGRILVDGPAMSNGEPERLYLFTEKAKIVKMVDGVEQPATAADLAVGMEVEAEYSGPMLLSYPGQVGADVIRILK